MDRQARIEHHPEVVFRDIGEGGVLLHAESGQYHELNPVGCRIWELANGATAQDVIGGVRKAFPDAPDRVEEEVLDFLAALEQRGLVVVEASD